MEKETVVKTIMLGIMLGTLVILIVLFTRGIIKLVKVNYEWTNQVGCYWSLADKSYTLSEKSRNIDLLVTALKSSKHSEYNALWLTTKDNSYECNLLALESLATRLKTIQKMDETSFAYQTAIQQITAQEQGEAHALLSNLKGCWILGNYSTIYWGWCAILLFPFLGINILCFVQVFFFILCAEDPSL